MGVGFRPLIVNYWHLGDKFLELQESILTPMTVIFRTLDVDF